MASESSIKIKVKSVPDEYPNADGKWVEVTADQARLQGPVTQVYGYLSKKLPSGYHAVQWEPVVTIRRPKYLSPTALQKWRQSRDEYVLNYLVHNRPPRFPQTDAMSVGSSFDAYVKCYIADAVWGKGEKEQFHFTTIFEKQVEEQNRDFALNAGKVCFDAYERCGALAELMKLVERSTTEPRMEFTAGGRDKHGNPLGTVNLGRGSGDVTPISSETPVVLLGKPDLEFTVGVKVLFDWKVNGFCSKSGASPVSGYRTIRDHEKCKSHKDFDPYYVGELEINMHDYLEAKKPDWALQTAVYHWLTGTPVGDQCVVMIDQLACRPVQQIRVANHRCEVSAAFQIGAYNELQQLWDIIESGHIYRDLSRDESDDRVAVLNRQADAYKDETSEGRWYAKLMGRA